MAQSRIPQDIIDSIIGNINIRDKSLLRTCTLVSHSFLCPSRKRLFAYIYIGSLYYCRNLLNFLVEHPYIHVKILNINYHSLSALCDNPASKNHLLPLLHLLLCSLEELAFGVHHSFMAVDWHGLPSNLRNILSDIIHSPSLTSLTLRSLTNVPNELFLSLKGVQTLYLERVQLNDITASEEHGVSRPADMNEAVKIWTYPESFIWHFEEATGWPRGPKSIVMHLPFLAHPRFVRFDAYRLDLINLFLNALGSSLQYPATLEHLQLSCATEISWFHDTNGFLADLDAIEIWTELDNLVTDPLYAHLLRVDIIIELYTSGGDGVGEFFKERFPTILPQKLPLLSSKGILHVRFLPISSRGLLSCKS